jgi:hypothetical protein
MSAKFNSTSANDKKFTGFPALLKFCRGARFGIMKTRQQNPTDQKHARKKSGSDPGRESKVKTYGKPEQAEGIGRRKIGGTMDSSHTEKQNQ